MTKYETKIFNLVKTSHGHMTVEEIYNLLKQDEPKVVLATVYNNIRKLVQNGKIKKLSIEGELDRYDRSERHDHLICSVCGAISDYRFSDLTSKLEGELGETINGYDLRITYVCPACKKKSV
ncbi:MAG: transcriptional repressor [Desulfovibrionaceae bacterium]|nr:transcriptional repressor [Desulfovibrionaceae bacterium]